jgi:hypothetical protein
VVAKEAVMWSFFEVDDTQQRRAERLAAAEEAFMAEIRQRKAALVSVAVDTTREEDGHGRQSSAQERTCG